MVEGTSLENWRAFSTVGSNPTLPEYIFHFEGRYNSTVEYRIVVPVVMGSNPIIRPILYL